MISCTALQTESFVPPKQLAGVFVTLGSVAASSNKGRRIYFNPRFQPEPSTPALALF
jgi:hypothetical protein